MFQKLYSRLILLAFIENSIFTLLDASFSWFKHRLDIYIYRINHNHVKSRSQKRPKRIYSTSPKATPVQLRWIRVAVVSQFMGPIISFHWNFFFIFGIILILLYNVNFEVKKNRYQHQHLDSERSDEYIGFTAYFCVCLSHYLLE